MLDILKTSLLTALKKIVNSSSVDEALIKELSIDIQRALSQSDVNVKLVFQMTKNLEERSVKETPPTGLSRKDNIAKILYEELAKLFGTEEQQYVFQSGKTNIVLMLGIQGSGKTTVTSKLAKLWTRQGYRVAVIGADTYRPDALTQLRTMCEKANVEVYGEEGNKDSPELVKNGLKHFMGQNFDIILIDTAGRCKEEKDLLDEMTKIGKIVNPDLVLLIIDGTVGQQCYNQCEVFHRTVPAGGIIITKLDRSAKGVGALVAAAATGAQIMFTGTGDEIDDLGIFSPKRFVSWMLRMADPQALLDMAKKFEDEQTGIKAIFSTLTFPSIPETELQKMRERKVHELIESPLQNLVGEEEIATMFFENVPKLREKIIELVDKYDPRPIILTMPDHSLYGECIFPSYPSGFRNTIGLLEIVELANPKNDMLQEEVFRYFIKDLRKEWYSDLYAKMRYGRVFARRVNFMPRFHAFYSSDINSRNWLGSELERIENFLDKEPHNIKGWYYKGIFLYNLRKYHDAITCYMKILASHPHEIMASYLLELAIKARNQNSTL
jgi:signal recognition particle subunit SRP54